MADFVRHVNGLKGTGITVSTTTDRRAALAGADYVVVVHLDRRVRRACATTSRSPSATASSSRSATPSGPGGVMRALRNIPVLVDIARDMEEICPDAWMLNITNPMTTLCRAVTRETSIKTVGLCHEITGAQFTLSQILDVDFRSFDFEVVGVNHLPIITALRIDGEDAMDRLREQLADPEKLADEPIYLPDEIRRELRRRRVGVHQARSRHEQPVKFALFERFGVLPGAGDRHLVEFFPGFLTEESEWGKRWNVGLTSIADREVWVDRYKAEFAQAARDHRGAEHAVGRDGRADDRLVPARQAARTSRSTSRTPASAPTSRPTRWSSRWCTATATASPAATTAHAPAALTECLRRVVASQEMTVEAAISGDRDTAVDAMLLDPLAGRIDFDHVAQMTDEMLAATARWLPQFA